MPLLKNWEVELQSRNNSDNLTGLTLMLWLFVSRMSTEGLGLENLLFGEESF